MAYLKLPKISNATATTILLVASLFSGSVDALRIKDITNVAGVRTNHLIGYGLVVGLTGTGDQTTQAPFTVQSLKNMLGNLGITLPPNMNPQLKNVAAVAVHAELPPFAKPGQRIDVTVSSIGNAKSLRGGVLLVTPLKGVDSETYVLAQGNLIVGGFGMQGSDGSSVVVNVPSAGRIPGGGQVERSLATSFSQSGILQFDLKDPDFGTAQRLVSVINEKLGPGSASAIDGSSVRIQASLDTQAKVALIAVLHDLTIKPSQSAAKVIINARTGTVVIGEDVRILPSAVTHGNLAVSISESVSVSQPGAFSGGDTVASASSEITIEEEANPMFLFDPGVSLDELVRAVNQVGAAPGDLVAILEALKEAGALQAELVVI